MMFGLTPFRKRPQWVDKGEVWNPWAEMDKAFDQFFNEPWLSPLFAQSGAMRVDIRETDKEYIVEAEIPGVDKKNIQLDLQDGILTISVKHDEQVNVEKDNYIRRERRATALRRSFQVDNVKEDAVTAAYNNGILTITLPKRAPGKKGRTIDIQ